MRNIPVITKNLLIINVLMFAAVYVFGRVGIDIKDMLGLHFFLASDFRFYQLFTYMFMHAGFEHIFFNMFALWMFGCVVENVWGPKRFLFYYIACGMGAGVIQELTQLGSFYLMMSSQVPSFGLADIIEAGRVNSMLLNAWTTVGASGSIYGILLAFGMIFPEERIFIFPLPVPIKAKWFVMFYAAIELFFALGTTGDNVAHFAHLGGMLFGYIMIRYWRDNGGGGNFGRNRGKQFFDKMRNSWEKHSNRRSNDRYDARRETDHEFNARKREEQKETDRILDKIRRSGYDSLTKEEKQKLFDNGKK